VPEHCQHELKAPQQPQGHKVHFRVAYMPWPWSGPRDVVLPIILPIKTQRGMIYKCETKSIGQQWHEMARGPREEDHGGRTIGGPRGAGKKRDWEEVQAESQNRCWASRSLGRLPSSCFRAPATRRVPSVYGHPGSAGQCQALPMLPRPPAQCSTLCPKALISLRASERAGEGGGRRLPRSDSPSARPGMDSGGTCIRGGST